MIVFEILIKIKVECDRVEQYRDVQQSCLSGHIVASPFGGPR